MGPRKKSKPNPEAESTTQDTTAQDTSSSNNEPTVAAPPQLPAQSDNVPVAQSSSLRNVGASHVSQSTPQLTGGRADGGLPVQRQVENRASWYGSWKGKARPVAEVARDTVPASPTPGGGAPASPRLPSSDRRPSTASAPSPRRYMSANMRKASKSDVVPASTSNLSAVSDNTKTVTEHQPPPPLLRVEEPPKELVPDPPLPPDPSIDTKQNKNQSPAKDQRNSSGSWFGWWSRPDGYIEKPAADDKKEAENKDKTTETALQKPLPESPADERTQPKLDQVQSKQTPSEPIPINNGLDSNKAASVNVGSQRNSWFWSWSSQQNAQGGERPPTSNGPKVPSTETPAVKTEPPKDAPVSQGQVPKPVEDSVQRTDAKATMKADAKTDPKNDAKLQQARKSTGWAFWSREEPENKDTGKVHKQVGEIAVADTPSQSNPEAAQFNEAGEQEQITKDTPKGKPKSLRGRSTPKDSPKQPGTPVKGTPSGSPERKPIEPKVSAVAGKPMKEQPKQAKETATTSKEDKNILLPDFNNTYSLLQQPSIWAQIRRLFVSDPHNFPGPHLHLSPTPPRPKKALAIGVHGFFPSPIYQKILGQPTGTSIRFSNCAAQAIKSWTDSRGYECSIEKVALEGEGFISERVDTLWKLLLNWIEHIRQADFILVACHSQGVPVAIMLVAKLIAFGCVSNARIGVCAMAGISLGPFAEYKTRIFGGSALELFDFAEPKSKVSEAYRGAVEEVLKAGVRIVYVGSIDDQLVSLESSTFAPISHPNIYRAVFIDGRLHTSDFLTNLIGFALKLRNLGLPDHGLIRELSPALAGSLYTGEGHSTLHNYQPIYDLAVRHALETVPADPVAPIAASQPMWGTLQGPPSVKDANPYFLPWAMRGILEEEAVRREMGAEVEELLRLFEEWKPLGKGLKDIKFRLEAVRSKL